MPFFGIFDGHNGDGCSLFIEKNIVDFIVKDFNFPVYPKQAIMNACHKLEKEFYCSSINKNGNLVDESGSCIIFALIIGNICYIANIGDSRAFCSRKDGQIIETITKDHKPEEESEKKRILKNGGIIYK